MAADDMGGPASPPSLPPSVPLRYQRPETKTHHFKKKFVHREAWEGFEDHLQPGKFRPKGKDWIEFSSRSRISLLPNQQH